MRILKFIEFINESLSLNESGIPIFRGTNFNSERTIKRASLLSELQNFLNQVMTGELDEVTVVAEIPTQGKNAPQYVKDLYDKMKDGSKEMGDENDAMYYENEEIDPQFSKGLRDEDKDLPNIFVDSEFIVKDIDMEKGVILGIPYSLKRKNIVVEIHPDDVEEVFIK